MPIHAIATGPLFAGLSGHLLFLWGRQWLAVILLVGCCILFLWEGSVSQRVGFFYSMLFWCRYLVGYYSVSPWWSHFSIQRYHQVLDRVACLSSPHFQQIVWASPRCGLDIGAYVSLSVDKACAFQLLNHFVGTISEIEKQHAGITKQIFLKKNEQSSCLFSRLVKTNRQGWLSHPGHTDLLIKGIWSLMGQISQTEARAFLLEGGMYHADPSFLMSALFPLLDSLDKKEIFYVLKPSRSRKNRHLGSFIVESMLRDRDYKKMGPVLSWWLKIISRLDEDQKELLLTSNTRESGIDVPIIYAILNLCNKDDPQGYCHYLPTMTRYAWAIKLDVLACIESFSVRGQKKIWEFVLDIPLHRKETLYRCFSPFFDKKIQDIERFSSLSDMASHKNMSILALTGAGLFNTFFNHSMHCYDSANILGTPKSTVNIESDSVFLDRKQCGRIAHMLLYYPQYNWQKIEQCHASNVRFYMKDRDNLLRGKHIYFCYHYIDAQYVETLHPWAVASLMLTFYRQYSNWQHCHTHAVQRLLCLAKSHALLDILGKALRYRLVMAFPHYQSVTLPRYLDWPHSHISTLMTETEGYLLLSINDMRWVAQLLYQTMQWDRNTLLYSNKGTAILLFLAVNGQDNAIMWFAYQQLSKLGYSSPKHLPSHLYSSLFSHAYPTLFSYLKKEVSVEEAQGSLRRLHICLTPEKREETQGWREGIDKAVTQQEIKLILYVYTVIYGPRIRDGEGYIALNNHVNEKESLAPVFEVDDMRDEMGVVSHAYV